MVWMTPEQAAPLARCAAVFEPGDPARTGRIAFWDPAGDAPPEAPGGEPGEAELVVRDGEDVALRTLPVLRLPLAHALPALALARRAAGGTAPAAATPTPTPTPTPTAATACGRIPPPRSGAGRSPSHCT